MKNKQSILFPLKRPLLIYLISLGLGLVLGIYVLQPEIGEQIEDLYAIALENFVSIFSANATIILMIYVSCIFTKLYAYFTYSINGIVQGIIVGWILISDVGLFWLFLPHGIFEIPCILATSYIVYKEESYIRANFMKFLRMLALHELAVLGCAIIEAYITPLFMRFM